RTHVFASLWRGSADSWTNLNPQGVGSSWLTATDGIVQVGGAEVGFEHASMWIGTPESWVDLNPPGATWSRATGVGGGEVVGNVSYPGVQHPVIWRGGAAQPAVDLYDGSTRATVLATDGRQQVGFLDTGVEIHACMWTGTANSRTDLGPAGALESQAMGVGNGYQVGYAYRGIGGYAASIWSGTADSWTDLSAYLPPGHQGNAEAHAVWSDGHVIRVAGWTSCSDYSYEAVVWVGLLPPRCGTADFDHDGNPATDADIEAFFRCIAGNCCPICESADFNGDGDVGTDADIEAFFRVLAGGTC
ncbi:MAG: hypothetical protein ABUL72_05070, partial [Armatimonadota bacterium]